MTRRPFKIVARLCMPAALVLVPLACALAQGDTARGQRDPVIAVQEEFAMAQAGDTVEGWELFIARHPDHALAEEARKRLRALRK